MSDALQPPQGSIVERSYYFEEAGTHMEYAIYVPMCYTKAVKTPLIVLLHGLFSNPHQAIRWNGIIEEAEDRGYIVVAPFGYNDRSFYGSFGESKLFPGSGPGNAGELSEKDVMNVLEITRQEFNIDAKRIFLMGHCMGGVGTLHLGSVYNEVWAGLAPMSFLLPPHWQRLLQPMQHIPVMVVTSSEDRITPVAPIQELVDVMHEFNMNVSYHELESRDHMAPVICPDAIAHVFDFFDTQNRAEPAQGVSVPTMGIPLPLEDYSPGRVSSKSDSSSATGTRNVSPSSLGAIVRKKAGWRSLISLFCRWLNRVASHTSKRRLLGLPFIEFVMGALNFFKLVISTKSLLW